MVKFSVKVMAVVFLASFMLYIPSFAMDNTVYEIPDEMMDINGGGGTSESSTTGYLMLDTVGQSAPVGKTGTNAYYSLDGGFAFTLLEATIETIIREIRVNGSRFYSKDIVPRNFTIAIDFWNADALTTVEVTVDEGLSWEKKFVLSRTGSRVGTEETWSGPMSISPRSEPTHYLTLFVSDEVLNSKKFVPPFECKVLGGQVQVIGTPLNWPNPFKPLSGGTTQIQYVLTTDSPVTIIIYDITGHEIRRMSYASGTNGGRADLNKVVWDGKSFHNEVIGNGMYIYKIISRDKVLGTGKLVVLD